MNANARGDKLDSANRVIDRKSNQINRQAKKQVATEGIKPSTSNSAVRQAREEVPAEVQEDDVFADLPVDEEVVEEQETVEASPLQGGLAAAIAKAKTVQQTKLPTPREAAKAAGVRKL